MNALWAPSDSEVEQEQYANYEVAFIEEMHKKCIGFTSKTIAQVAT